jgi:hypothetical protein
MRQHDEFENLQAKSGKELPVVDCNDIIFDCGSWLLEVAFETAGL